MSTTISNVRQFLEFGRDAARKLNALPEGYTGICDFILQHGQQFEPGDLPEDIAPGPAGMCFHNAAIIALHSPLVYCEGYATGIIPVLHAWLVDPISPTLAIDPTWTGRRGRVPMGTDYYGLTIKRSFLNKHILRSREWGSILDDWRHHWPITKIPVADWQHQFTNTTTAK
jgi:hypothetical protein